MRSQDRQIGDATLLGYYTHDVSLSWKPVAATGEDAQKAKKLIGLINRVSKHVPAIDHTKAFSLSSPLSVRAKILEGIPVEKVSEETKAELTSLLEWRDEALNARLDRQA